MPSRGRRRWVGVVEVDVVEVEVEVEVEVGLGGRVCVGGGRKREGTPWNSQIMWPVVVGYAPRCLACALFKERVSKTRCRDVGGMLIWCFSICLMCLSSLTLSSIQMIS